VLFRSYASQRQRQSVSSVVIKKRDTWSLNDAREILLRLIGKLDDWTALDAFLVDYITRPEDRASVIASSFAASLELVREGQLEIRQMDTYAPIYLRQKTNNNSAGAG